MVWRVHTESAWEWVFREFFAMTRQPCPYKAARGSSVSGGNCESLRCKGRRTCITIPRRWLSVFAQGLDLELRGICQQKVLGMSGIAPAVPPAHESGQSAVC